MKAALKENPFNQNKENLLRLKTEGITFQIVLCIPK